MLKKTVLGYGVVGSGVVELFYRNQKKNQKNTGTELEIGYILDLREFPDDPYGDRVVHDIQVILDDPEVVVVLRSPLSGSRQESCHFQQAAGC